MKRLVLITLLLIAAAGCASNSLTIIPRSQLRELAPDLYGSNVKNNTPGTATVRLYMVEGTRLVEVERTGQSTLPIEKLAMTELLKGPTATELARGVTTNIPNTVQLLDVSIQNGIATVDLTKDFELATDDQTAFLLRLAQVVYTMTELNGVQSVRFEVQTQPVYVLVQDGQYIPEPVARGRYSNFAPISAGAPVAKGPLGS